MTSRVHNNNKISIHQFGYVTKTVFKIMKHLITPTFSKDSSSRKIDCLLNFFYEMKLTGSENIWSIRSRQLNPFFGRINM